MATINSVSLYLSRGDIFTEQELSDRYVGVNIGWPSMSYTTNPVSGGGASGKTLPLSDISVGGGWVTFIFNTPVEIDEDSGFIAVHLYTDIMLDQYQNYHIYWHGASDWIEAAIGAPYVGKEHSWNKSSSGWYEDGVSRAYVVNTTDADEPGATVAIATKYASGEGEQGVRAFIVPTDSPFVDAAGTISITSDFSGIASALTKPPKATNPFPANKSGSGRNTYTLTWELEE
jgi:hypothetical protein